MTRLAAPLTATAFTTSWRLKTQTLVRGRLGGMLELGAPYAAAGGPVRWPGQGVGRAVPRSLPEMQPEFRRLSRAQQGRSPDCAVPTPELIPKQWLAMQWPACQAMPATAARLAVGTAAAHGANRLAQSLNVLANLL